jgi:hypothetical protein
VHALFENENFVLLAEFTDQHQYFPAHWRSPSVRSGGPFAVRDADVTAGNAGRRTKPTPP